MGFSNNVEKIESLILTLDRANIEIGLTLAKTQGVFISELKEDLVALSKYCHIENFYHMNAQTRGDLSDALEHFEALPLIEKILKIRAAVDFYGYLAIRHNESKFPPRFSLLHRIQLIHAYNISFFPIELSELKKLKSLKKLEFKDCLIYYLPIELQEIKTIEEFFFEGGKFYDFKEVPKFQNLKKLTIKNAELRVLPVGIEYFKQLTYLDLSGNKLSSLPKEIGCLSNLEELNLSNNQLRELPESIRNLKKLKRLNLSHNQISELPEDLGGVFNVREYNVNPQESSSFQRLKDISELYGLDNIKSGESSKEIVFSSNLEELDLSNNQLKELPKSITKLNKLKKLNLSYNQLTELPKGLGSLYSIKEINLKHNDIHSFSEPLNEIKLLRRLEEFNYSNNPILEQLKEKDIKYFFPPNFFSGDLPKYFTPSYMALINKYLAKDSSS